MVDSVKFKVSYLNRQNQLSEVQEIELPNEDSGTTELKSKVADAFNVSTEEFDVFFGVKCLASSNDTFADLGLVSGMKLYAIEKEQTMRVVKPTLQEFETVRNAMFGLSTMFSHSRRSRQRNKTAVMKFVEDKEAMDAIIDSIEGLKDDEIALDVLANVKLMEVILDPKNTKNVLENHPCLANAFVAMWNSLMSSSKYANFDPVPGTSSDSQESMEVDGARPHSREASMPSRNINITSSQLAAALAQTYSVDNNEILDHTATTSSHRQTQRDTPSSGITAEAMQQALMSTGFEHVSEAVMNDSRASNATVSEDVIKSGLEQLKAMGITDEVVCRQALIATQGNVEAAIGIIFGGS